MKKNRLSRLNSLLKEVITEIIIKEVHNPKVAKFTTATSVDISADLRHAKVFVSVIGTDIEKKETLDALNSAAGFIALKASKLVVVHYFPELVFKLDNSVEEHLKIETVLKKIHEEQDSRDSST